MNPMTNIKNTQKLNERELELGIIGKKSWHDDYKDSAWIFIGGLPYDLSEGDIICVFSQYGEIVNLNLVRDHKTGKSKGFAFICYEDQRSTVLSVDNLNGIKILGRTVRVDHVHNYKVPKDHKDDDEMVRKMREEGCAPRVEESSVKDEREEEKKKKEDDLDQKKKRKKKKGDKEKKKKKKKEKKKSATKESSSSDSSDSERQATVKIDPGDIKKEREDKGYTKALLSSESIHNGSSSRDEDGQDWLRNDSRSQRDQNSDDSDEEEVDRRRNMGRDSKINRDRDFSRNGSNRDRRNFEESGKNTERDSHKQSERVSRNRDRSSRERDREGQRGLGYNNKRDRQRSRSRSHDRSRSHSRERYRSDRRDRDYDRHKDSGKEKHRNHH